MAAGRRQRGPRRRRHHRRVADAERRREAAVLGGRRRGGDDPRHRRLPATTPPTTCTSPSRRPSAASPGSSPCARTTTGRRRPGIEAHLRAIAAATELPVVVYDIPIRTGRKIATDVLVRLANEVAQRPRRQGRRRQPGRDGAADRRRAGRFEVYSGDDMHDAAAARRRRGRRDRRRRRTGSRPTRRVLRRLGEGRHRRPAVNAACSRATRSRPATRRPNPLPSKAMLRHLGQPAGHCRPPWAPTRTG